MNGLLPLVDRITVAAPPGQGETGAAGVHFILGFYRGPAKPWVGTNEWRGASLYHVCRSSAYDPRERVIKTPWPISHVHPADEGITWIRGWVDEDSDEAKTLLVAYEMIFRERAE